MFSQILILFFCFILALSIILINFFVSEKQMFIKNKMSWFESGIENKSSSRYFFSVHFFMICIVFIMFDTEIIFLFNFLFKSSNWLIFIYFIKLLIISLFIVITLFLEFLMNNLSWKY